MRYIYTTAALGASVSAAVLDRRTPGCCFGITVSGAQSGPLGQLSDGQNRVGPAFPNGAQYCIDKGSITDANGRGCILTPPTTQFQCDEGTSPTAGFGIVGNGQIQHNGSDKFYACPVDDNGNYNIYTENLPNMPKCVEVRLATSNGAQCAAPSSPAAPLPTSPTAQTSEASAPSAVAETKTEKLDCSAPSTVTVVKTAPGPPPSSAPASVSTTVVESVSAPVPATSAPPAVTSQETKPQSSSGTVPSSTKPAVPTASGCPANLKGNYQYPHLIVPVDSSKPDQALGTSYNGTISSTVCSIFNFDIPQSYAGHSCSLVFLFPEQKDLETSSFSTSGNGGITFKGLHEPANEQTTFANTPAVEQELDTIQTAPGNSYTIVTNDCPAGYTVGIELCGSGDYQLNYFQDYNPSPIGLYVTEC